MICSCCARIAGRVPGPVEWRWYTHGGSYSCDLCDACMAHWLHNAVEDPDLRYHRLHPILVGMQ